MMNFLKKIYRNTMSLLIYVVAKVTGPLHAPWTKKLLDYKDVCDALKYLQKGDILLTRTKGQLTTLTIPGYWKHAAGYIGNKGVVEAVDPKVKLTHLNDFMRTDYIAILRMVGITQDEQDELAKQYTTHIGKLYDFWMRFKNPDKVSCSEVIYLSSNAVRKNYFELWYRLGYPSFTPTDCYKARNKFELIWEKR